MRQGRYHTVAGNLEVKEVRVDDGTMPRSSAARRHIVGPGAAFALQIVGLAVAEPVKL